MQEQESISFDQNDYELSLFCDENYTNFVPQLALFEEENDQEPMNLSYFVPMNSDDREFLFDYYDFKSTLK